VCVYVRLCDCGVCRGGKYVKARLPENEEPREVSETTRSRIAKAKHLSNATVMVSKSLMTGALVCVRFL